MNIWGVVPNFTEAANVKAANKSTTNMNNYKGPSFVESMHDVARSANIEVAKGNIAAQLQLMRQKEEYIKPYNFLEEEEEMLEDSVDKIKQLMEELEK